MAVNKTTSLVADVQWIGEQVQFGKTSFTTTQLTNLVQSLTLELRHTIRQLLLVERVEGEKGGEGKGEEKEKGRRRGGRCHVRTSTDPTDPNA